VGNFADLREISSRGGHGAKFHLGAIVEASFATGL
jgi:hypothetical protein